MPRAATSLRGDADRSELHRAFESIRTSLDVPGEFIADVMAAAQQAAASVELPDRDETAVEFVTIDPPGSMDLDQAMHLERDGEGYRVRYAIADVPAFVEPGGLLDQATRARGQTIYCPDLRVPLHPTLLSEGAASLLPEQDRAAYVWDMRLDAEGRRCGAEVYRAVVRSRRRYDYGQVQEQVDAGTGEVTLLLLREVGELRIARESARGGASLPMPEQEVIVTDDGHYELRLAPVLRAEDWNAQISLLTGMVAAQLMLEGKMGILRTLPPAEQRDMDRFRRQARTLGVTWPKGLAYGDFLRTLDRTDPHHLALIHEATALFRGAGYTPFDGSPPEQPEQAAIAAPYAHVTAPLRRLVDRFGLVVCAALSAGMAVPGWARQALPDLPELMAVSDKRARAVERACTDAVEAAVLHTRLGERFSAIVVDLRSEAQCVVQLTDPAVSARADGTAELGAEVTVELVRADVGTQQVLFRIVGAAP